LLLAAEDRPQLNRLLDEVPDWLPMYDRIEAAQRAGRPGLAQTLAFDQLARLPSDEDLHLRLTTMTTEQPASFAATVNQMTVSPLSAREVHLQTSVNLTPGLKLTIALIDRQYRSLDETALVNLPGSDRQLELTLRKQLDDGMVSVTVQQRQAAGSQTGLRLDYNLTLSSAISVAGTLGTRQLATESALLRVAAMRDGVASSTCGSDWPGTGMPRRPVMCSAAAVTGTLKPASTCVWNTRISRCVRWPPAPPIATAIRSTRWSATCYQPVPT
jgi:hypothetical protein